MEIHISLKRLGKELLFRFSSYFVLLVLQSIAMFFLHPVRSILSPFLYEFLECLYIFIMFIGLLAVQCKNKSTRYAEFFTSLIICVMTLVFMEPAISGFLEKIFAVFVGDEAWFYAWYLRIIQVYLVLEPISFILPRTFDCLKNRKKAASNL